MIRRKTIKPALLAALFFCSVLSYGQTDNNEFDKKYTPNQNSIFNNLIKKNTDASRSADIEIRHSIKFYPTMAARQKIFFSYTFDLGKGFATELGIGKAFGTDLLQAGYFGLFEDSDQSAGTSLTANEVLKNSNYSGSGPLFSIGFKIYFSGKTFDGGYIDFTYRYEKMNYLMDPSVDGQYRVDGDGQASFNMNAAYFGFGYTAVSGAKNNFTHDFFISFGLKAIKYTDYSQVVLNIAGTSSTEQVYQRSGLTISARVLPAINMGYAFGFGF